MISEFVFGERIKALWESQKRMAAPKKWKSGARAGTIRKQPVMIEFTKDDLYGWLWTRVGVGIAQCSYCTVPIDILNLTLDHAIPRAAGGRFALDNMRPCCEECNQRKGNLTETAYREVIAFSYAKLSSYDRNVLLKRLAAAHHGSPARFFRKPEQKPAQLPPPAQQNALDLSGLGQF